MNNWQEKDGKLQAKFELKDFAEAWAFMTEVAIHAEKQAHHPEWSNVYNIVKISLCTHDAGDIVTDKDHRLAKTIDGIYSKFL